MSDEEEFQRALARPRLSRPVPEFLDSNRSVEIRAIPESELHGPHGDRYMGSGHWSGPLRLYPYDEGAPTIYGTGRFIQAPAVDRYHFNKEGLMIEGETLYDFLDAVQRAGILPRDDSFAFRALMGASKIPAVAQQIGRRLRGK